MKKNNFKSQLFNIWYWKSDKYTVLIDATYFSNIH